VFMCFMDTLLMPRWRQASSGCHEQDLNALLSW
jgi:hypothetical protein